MSDTNYVVLKTNDASRGCLLNGDWNGYRGKSLIVEYNPSLNRFVEISRS
jgi:hypothetical protein